MGQYALDDKVSGLRCKQRPVRTAPLPFTFMIWTIQFFGCCDSMDAHYATFKRAEKAKILPPTPN
jgi:hypothetical protein